LFRQIHNSTGYHLPIALIFTAMLTIGQAFYDIKNALQPLYEEREAAAIAHEVLNSITGYSKTDRLMHKDEPLGDLKYIAYNKALADLRTGRPLQYILGSSWFLGREFIVNEAVLIPRPETEELVQWIINDLKAVSGISILDIGTGSGCIPISLKLDLPAINITACDISPDALAVAETNATKLGANVQFTQSNFLDPAQQSSLGNFDVIVSNPPYIPISEQDKMHTNVKDHEPNIALFVPDNDPLLFYKAIATFGKDHLKGTGYIYCELDAGHATQTKAMFEDAGYNNVQIRQDIHGNWRMLKAELVIKLIS
jgi:release factor glutamine methyltransferase